MSFSYLDGFQLVVLDTDDGACDGAVDAKGVDEFSTVCSASWEQGDRLYRSLVLLNYFACSLRWCSRGIFTARAACARIRR